ncbi:GTPase HflX [bacterium]|nr:GTPase HflX [bacterium]MDY2885617.1 GTPase HflX [Bariatricus sp.]
MAIYEIKDEKEKLILVGVASSANDDTEQSLDELCDLVDTAGGVVVGRVIQRREMIHPATYVGKGKIEEIKELLWETDADGIVCDDELSPAQTANLTELLDTKVMDRTLIILDIFAGRASTSEGKIQVELAQLRYRQTQLTGAGKALSRLGGGIGTRGPGEKKLEMDRRLIKNRIALLNRELKDVKRHRDLTREQRSRNHMQVAAIVGYTNAGKSTLLNTLTDAKVLEEDQLFATLDPTTRNLKLPSGQEMLVTDTVGFIRKLPHHLIEAFRSTLEEAKYADLILHVVDSSNPQMDEQMYVVYETLRKLEVMNKPVITVFNKMDRRGENALLRDFQADRTVQISAKTGEGIPELLCTIEQQLREQKILIERMYPYQESSRVQMIRKYGELLEEHYTEEGIYIRAYVPKEIYGRSL